MRKAIGFLIILGGMSYFLDNTFQALDSAATESLKALEAAAIASQEQFIQ